MTQRPFDAPRPWLATTDYIMSLGRVRVRGQGEPIQPREDRAWLSQNAERLGREIKRLGCIDGVLGIARPLSRDRLAELGLATLAPISVGAILPELYLLHSLAYRRMREFVERLDRLSLQLKLLPALPATPQAMLALHRAIFAPDERRDWRGQSFHLGEPGADLFDERMQDLGYDYATTPWVMLTFDWPIDQLAEDWSAWESVVKTLDDEDAPPASG